MANDAVQQSASHVTRIFLNIPNMDGHRQVYCRELCDYFLSRGCSVTVSTDTTALARIAELSRLLRLPQVRFVRDTWTNKSGAAAQLKTLVVVARHAGADVTFLAEADGAHGLLAAQVARPRYRLPGRRVGLFIRSTNYIHRTQCNQVGRLGKAVIAAYSFRPLSLARPRLFHEVIAQHFSVLDAALCLDEVFAASQGSRYVWLPDIAVASVDYDADGAEAAEWAARVSDFVQTQHGRPVVVYAGTPYARRGYQALLELTRDIDGCFIHCGRLYDPDGDDPDEDRGARAALVARSAILESGRAYQSFETAQVTLRAARCVVLPYSRHLGSSGVMLQALMAGRPVLVPDQGLMAWRVRNFGLGLTFASGDSRDMRYRFSVLQNTPPGVFADAVSQFTEYFVRAQRAAALDLALGMRGTTLRVPTRKE